MGVEMARSRRSGAMWLLLGCLLAGAGCGDGGGASEFLRDPSSAEVNMMAPEVFQTRFETSRGTFVVESHRAWSPNGVDRFYNLVQNGFFDDVRFFRVIEGFMAQFGINGDPQIQSAWRDANISDDPVVMGNTRGRLSFAKTGMPDSRSTQLFINFRDNSRLDEMGFSAIGEVIEGMEVVDALYAGYGEGAPGGNGPSQGRIQEEGNLYLEEDFPNLDYIERARIVSEN
ncbi:peptidylprolyl isomerase [Candidatus Palauibacter sp.]|uniref:peptidylprolyl isomerase n=1 Tax=Candidatus Palauibacter sp. TaxID=3101350 RepID=UPI003B5B4228